MKQRTYRMQVEEITVTVVKKQMKNMYLRIRREDGSVLISAPAQMEDARIYAFAKERIDWIRKYKRKYEAIRDKSGPREALSTAERERQKRERKAQTEKLVAKWEPVMGVQVSGITIRQMKTRWGSCNVRTHHININLALLQKPPFCLEYVVVHEMTHILEASHSPVFWSYMTQFYPDWKRVRNYLKDETTEV